MPLLSIERFTSAAATPSQRGDVLELCNRAFGEDLSEYSAAIGPGVHLLGRWGNELAAHVMWVPRQLQVGGSPVVETAYVELVATDPAFQRRGFASRLLTQCVSEIPESCGLAALCPAVPEPYVKLGWQWWEGPLSVRMPSGEEMLTPDERVMIFALPRRPTVNRAAPLSIEWRPGEIW